MENMSDEGHLPFLPLVLVGKKVVPWWMARQPSYSMELYLRSLVWGLDSVRVALVSPDRVGLFVSIAVSHSGGGCIWLLVNYFSHLLGGQY